MPSAPPSRPAPPSSAQPSLPPGLVYVSPDMPGLTRVRRGRGFAYRHADGQWETRPEEIDRIRRLAIPPAYSQVWICPLPHGHLQATGRDARGRRQYRYHPAWQQQRDAAKFDRMQAFGKVLPRIRARVQRDLAAATGTPAARAVTRPVVLGAIVRLLDTTFLRVGNEEYASSNGSYGLTTLRNRHAGVKGHTLRLRFRGKSGVQQEAHLSDPRVARVVRRCQELPGQELFQYLDDDGSLRTVGSADVNDYLREITGTTDEGHHFTAKDFRTWHGSVQALELTRQACTAPPGPQAATAKHILAEVARQLGNTPAVCKKAYIHPAVLGLGEQLAADTGPGLQAVWDRLGSAGSAPRGLSAAERRLLAFLRRPARRSRRAPQAA